MNPIFIKLFKKSWSLLIFVLVNFSALCGPPVFASSRCLNHLADTLAPGALPDPGILNDAITNSLAIHHSGSREDSQNKIIYQIIEKFKELGLSKELNERQKFEVAEWVRKLSLVQRYGVEKLLQLSHRYADQTQGSHFSKFQTESETFLLSLYPRKKLPPNSGVVSLLWGANGFAICGLVQILNLDFQTSSVLNEAFKMILFPGLFCGGGLAILSRVHLLRRAPFLIDANLALLWRALNELNQETQGISDYDVAQSLVVRLFSDYRLSEKIIEAVNRSRPRTPEDLSTILNQTRFLVRDMSEIWGLFGFKPESIQQLVESYFRTPTLSRLDIEFVGTYKLYIYRQIGDYTQRPLFR